MKHTKEPWHVMENGFGVKCDNGYPTVYAADTELRYVCKCADSINIIPTDNLANAERIVACVNACEDLTNKHLNSGVVYRLIVLQSLIYGNAPKDEIIRLSNEIHEIIADGED